MIKLEIILYFHIFLVSFAINEINLYFHECKRTKSPDISNTIILSNCQPKTQETRLLYQLIQPNQLVLSIGYNIVYEYLLLVDRVGVKGL